MNINETGTGNFSVYPNPTFGNFTVNASVAGKFELYTTLGQKLEEYNVIAGQTALQLPMNIAVGIYMGLYKPNDGGTTKEVKFVYQP